MTTLESSWLRRAGRGRLPDDGLVLWSVAEGQRGRRWRWMNQVHQAFRGTSGLVELSPGGQLRRLELDAYGGLLTFHPDADGRSAHGNIVTADRVYPIETAWQADWGVGIVDDPFGSAVARWAGIGLVVAWQHGAIVWREGGDHPDIDAMPSDARGIPILPDAQEWDLEA